MVGTFNRAPEPGATPFVEVGQLVEADTIVCIIEVMKLMHSMRHGTKALLPTSWWRMPSPLSTDRC
jgi:hypothetical protein